MAIQGTGADVRPAERALPPPIQDWGRAPAALAKDRRPGVSCLARNGARAPQGKKGRGRGCGAGPSPVGSGQKRTRSTRPAQRVPERPPVRLGAWTVDPDGGFSGEIRALPLDVTMGSAARSPTSPATRAPISAPPPARPLSGPPGGRRARTATRACRSSWSPLVRRGDQRRPGGHRRGLHPGQAARRRPRGGLRRPVRPADPAQRARRARPFKRIVLVPDRTTTGAMLPSGRRAAGQPREHGYRRGHGPAPRRQRDPRLHRPHRS